MITDLNLQIKKIELIQLLSAIDDEEILDKLSDLITKEKKIITPSSASSLEEKSIEKGIIEADNGKLHPHIKAQVIYGKWL